MPRTEKLEGHLAALVHHVELSKGGWRERAIELLILVTCFEAKHLLTRQSLYTHLNGQLEVPIGRAQVESAINRLCQKESLFETTDDKYKLSEATWQNLEANFKTADSVERDVINLFAGHFAGFAEDERPSWNNFKSNFLNPLINELGARTYELVSGGREAASEASAHVRFLSTFPADVRADLAIAISAFFDSSNAALRRFILNRLNATFLVRATALGEETLRVLSEATKRRLTMSVFVDTNFLFSLVGLHENPADDVVEALNDIIRRTGGQTDVRLYVLPITLDEARDTIGRKREQLSGIIMGRTLARAVHRGTSDFSGITLKYLREALKVSRPVSSTDYFEPYLNNLVEICRAHGVELYNADVGGLGGEQDVIDDLLSEKKWQEERRAKGAKPYPVIRHDMVLWHFVERKRPTAVESPVEARYWIATIDFGFLAFDRYKKRQLGKSLPLAVHPTVLLQMLQFWVPQSEELELALINSLQPMLPHEFDAAAERVTLRILRALSRYQNVDDLGEKTLGRIFVDEVVRSRVAATEDIAEQIDVVESAIIRHAEQLRREAEDLKEEREELREEKSQLDREVRERSDEVAYLREEIVRINAVREEERKQRRQDERRIEELQGSVQRLEEEDQRRREGGIFRRRRMWFAIGTIVFGVGLLLFVAWFLAPRLSAALGFGLGTSAAIVIVISVASVVAVADYVGNKLEGVSDWVVVKFFHSIRVWLWGVIGTVVLGILVAYLSKQFGI